MIQKSLIVLATLAAIIASPALAEAKIFKNKKDAPSDPFQSYEALNRQPSPSDPEVHILPVVPEAVGPAVCCPQRCFDYKHHFHCKRFRCSPTIETVLLVKDPCVCGCFVEVPVCLPVCCTGAPEVDCHRGLLGRDVVEYDWCCGYKVKVVFDRRGDVTVHYYGT
jgi:hypothetical protein